MLESSGIATVSVTMRPEITRAMSVPRAGWVRFPIGNAFGEPGKHDLQRDLLTEVLSLIHRAPAPGTIAELPFRWRRGRISG